MSFFSKFFPSPALKTMLGALEVVADDLRRNCQFSLFGGVQTFESLIQGCENSLRNKPDFLEQIMSDGRVTPLVGIWKVIFVHARQAAVSEEGYEEREAFEQIYRRSLDELARLSFFTPEQVSIIRQRFAEARQS